MKKIGKKWSRKKKRIALIAAVAVILVGGGITFGVMRGRTRGKMPTQSQSVTEVTAQTGDISNTIVGTGNLEMDTAVSVQIPSGVTVESVNVESGDHVSKGDVLATVEKSSVLAAIEEVQEQIDALDEEIGEAEEDEETQVITAKVSGTIEKIYIEEDDEISECMLEHGALMVISLETGETLEITGTSGTVDEVNVSEGDEVEKGDTLLTLDDSGQTLETQTFIAKRAALAATLTKLIELSDNNKITADMDGTIAAVNVQAGSDNTGTQTSGMSATNMSYTGKATGSYVTCAVVRTANVVSETEGGGEASKGVEGEKLQLAIGEQGTSGAGQLVIETPQKGKTPQSEIATADGSYTGTISWNPNDQAFGASTTYTAVVTLTAAEGYYFDRSSITGLSVGVLSVTSVDEQGKTICFQITYPETAPEESEATPTPTPAAGKDVNPTQAAKKEETPSATETPAASSNGNNQKQSQSGTDSQSGDGQNNSGQSNAGSSVQSAGTQSSGTQTTADSSQESSSGSAVETDSQYSTDVTAFTISGDEEMLLSVNVDELDINSVSVGQEAEVTFDAIEDETFTGNVTQVGNTASASGGVAKYTVQISIPKSDEMKVGMNASATIVIENRENVITIPVNALQERGQEVFVYTQKDEEGNLSGEQTVTTGLSDGDYVEITEGLSQGDTVYYQKIGNTSSGDSNMGDFGGEMPGGGQMNDMSGGGGFDGGSGGGGGGMQGGMQGGPGGM